VTDQPLGKPGDRYTFRFDRFYPHPITLVWQALTRAEHLDSWLSPGSEVEARPGGRFRLAFGERAAAHLHGTIESFRPFTLVVYAFDNGDRMRFELSPVRDGTRVVLTHSIPPGFPDPDGTGAAEEGAPNGVTPQRPRPADMGAVRAAWRIVERLTEEPGDGRRQDATHPREIPRDVRVWRRQRSGDRHDVPRSVPWDGRCRHRPSRGPLMHGREPDQRARGDAGDQTSRPSFFPRVIGAAGSPDGVLRLAVRGESRGVLVRVPIT